MKEFLFVKRGENIFYTGQYVYEDENYILIYEGSLSLHGKKLSGEELARWIAKNENLSELDGLYSLIFYSKKTQTVIATQDVFSYCHSLYFTQTQDGIIVSLQLRRLIVETGAQAQMDDKHIAEFLYNGFLTDDRCLVKGVKKIPAMHVLQYNCKTGEWHYKKKYYMRSDVLKGECYCDWVQPVFEDVLTQTAEINMALSSGYDSNLLLHMAAKHNPNCKIHAFCIGSCDGQDETESVKEICKEYPQVELTVCKVTPDILQAFPQIVYELEDNIFERGIFLQYLLAESLKQYGEYPILLGEGADQLLSVHFNTNAEPYYFVGKEDHYPWVYYPYEMLTYIILKKNGIFLRNRDMQTKYPFITKEFISGVQRFRKENGTDKTHYKQYIKACVSERVAQRLIKRPGSTNLSSLFDDSNIDRLFTAAKNSRFYSMLTKQPDRDSGSEVEKDNCLKIIYLILFERIFCEGTLTSLQGECCTVRFEDIIS